MKFSDTIIKALTDLKTEAKFAPDKWEERGLNPSADKLCIALETNLNQTIDSLIQNQSVDSDYVFLLNQQLTIFADLELDTEEREFVCDYFEQLAQILNVDLSKVLDEWMYGPEINTIKKKPIKILNQVTSPCKKCATPLTIKILRTRDGIPAFWLIVQCDECNEFNTLTIPPNTDIYANVNYFVFEKLSQTENTEDQLQKRVDYFIKANQE